MEPIYTIEILGTGPAFDAVHATLDSVPHLPLPGASYLVSGDAARDALRAYHGRGDVSVTARQSTSLDADEVLAPAGVIAAFIAHHGRDMDLAFRWDDEAFLWCLSSKSDGMYAESDDQEAPDELTAAKAALAHVLSDQDR